MRSAVYKKIFIITMIFALATEFFAPGVNYALAQTETNSVPAECGPADLINTTQIDMDQLYQSTRNLLSLADNDKPKLKIDAYDYSELKKYTVLYEAIKNDPEFLKAYEQNPVISDELKKEFGITSDPSQFDVRILDSIINLITPKSAGGAGREWIKVASIVKGYSSEKTGNPLKIADSEQLKKDGTSFVSNLTAAHYKQMGQAADITEIDKLRGTKFVYKSDENGNEVLAEKIKMDDMPIQVAWQTDKATSNVQDTPSEFGASMANVANNFYSQELNATLGNWLSEQGIDLTKLGVNYIADLGGNLANITNNVSGLWLKDNWDIPFTSIIGGNLGYTGNQLGQTTFSETLNSLIPASGLAGTNTKEMMINAGREKLASNMGLPEYSFQDGGTDSKKLLDSVGRRVMENNLGLSNGSLSGSAANKDDLYKKIGQGFIENSLSLPSGSFAGNSLEEVTKTIGSSKLQDIIDNSDFVDGILYLDIGTTAAGINSPANYKLAVGKKVIENEIDVYAKGPDGSDKRDQVFNLYNPDKSGIMQKFLDNDQNVFGDIGINAIAKSLSEDTNDQKVIRNWLTTGQIETDPARNNTPKINEELLSQSVNLKAYDLWRTFVYNQGDDVFERYGWTNWLSAIAPNYDQNESADINSSPELTFYRTRYTQIKDQASTLGKSTNNTTVKALCEEIYTLAKDMETYGEDTQQISQTLLWPYEEKTKNYIAKISGKLAEIQKSEPNLDLSATKKLAYEIIDGNSLTNLSQVSENDITSLTRPYYLNPDYKTSLMQVLRNQKSLNDFIQEQGLYYLGSVASLNNPSDLIGIWRSIKNNPNQNSTDILKNALGTDQLSVVAEEINNGFSLAPLGTDNDYYKVSIDDVAKFLVGSNLTFDLKLGSYAMDKALYLSPGNGSKEIIKGASIDSVMPTSGLNRFTSQILGLIENSPQDGNISDNISKLYLSENLGLNKNFAFNTSAYFQEPRNYARVLQAFGIKIPDELGNDWTKIIDWAKSTQPWNESIYQSSITTQVGFLGLNLGQAQGFLSSVFSNSASDISMDSLINPVKQLISQNYFEKDRLNEGFGLDSSASKGLDFLLYTATQASDLKKAFENSDGGNFFNLLANGATNTIMNGSNFAWDSGALGNPQNANDLKSLSLILPVLSNGKNKKAVEEGFITFGVNAVTSYFPDAMKYADKATYAYNFIQAFVGGITSSERNQRTADAAKKVSEGATKSLISSMANADEVNVDLNKALSDGTISFYDMAVGGLTSLNDYSLALKEAGLDSNKINSEYNAELPTYSLVKEQAGIITQEQINKAYEERMAQNAKVIDAAVKGTSQDVSNLVKQKQDTISRTAQDGLRKGYIEDYFLSTIDAQLMQNRMPPLARVLIKGTPDQKREAMRQFVVYSLASGQGMPAWGAAVADILTKALIDKQKVDPTQLSAAFDVALSGLLKLDFVPAGLGQGFSSWILEGDTTQVMKSLQDSAILYGTTFLDKTLGMPQGTTYAMYSMWNTYQTALTAYNTAVSNLATAWQDVFLGVNSSNFAELSSNLAKADIARTAALEKLQLTTASIASTAVNMIFGGTFQKLDQNLGLPSGTVSLIVTTAIYTFLGGMTLQAALGMLWPAAALTLLPSLFGIFGGHKPNSNNQVTRIEVIYSACGYYPGIDSGPPSGTEANCPAEFHGETQELFMKGAMAAANFVIQDRLLPNLLTMGERMGDSAMQPNRIETLQQSHVDQNMSLADEAYCGESGCMIKAINAGSRRGFGPNQVLWDRVYYAY